MFFGGENVEWSVKEQGLQVVIEVWCDDKGDGLYKAYAVGAGGSFLLGTMMPESGMLCLRHSILAGHRVHNRGVGAPARHHTPVRACGHRCA